VEKIEVAKLIGSTWHYYKRVPKRLVEAFDLASMFQHYKNGFIRGSMKTQDPNEARGLWELFSWVSSRRIGAS